MITSYPSTEPEERWLLTEDGIRILAQYHPAMGGPILLVVIHGFNASIAKEANRRVLARVQQHLPTVAIDLRGHGRSVGVSTLGGAEIDDVSAAVRWGRTLGFERVATLGFSMGAAIVVRHAGLVGGVDAVAAVSGPAFWEYRGTPVMRRLHFGVVNPVARSFLRLALGTTVQPPPWPDPYPPSPEQAAASIPPTPFLVVHGTGDGFFPDEHPRAMVAAAARGAALRGVADRTDLWLERFGHAEAAIPDETLDRICQWVIKSC